jgi:hypothetical protein
MTHVVVLNLVFFFPAVTGAATFAFLISRFLRTSAPPSAEEGGSAFDAGVPPRSPVPAGPDDLSRSA